MATRHQGIFSFWRKYVSLMLSFAFDLEAIKMVRPAAAFNAKKGVLHESTKGRQNEVGRGKARQGQARKGDKKGPYVRECQYLMQRGIAQSCPAAGASETWPTCPVEMGIRLRPSCERR
jgi:hypothetical protein